nr:MAG TPA: hypothetical protein [Caudoviricetes sp.]
MASGGLIMGVRNCADLGRNLQKIIKRLLAD